jgi:hypothetical protein
LPQREVVEFAVLRVGGRVPGTADRCGMVDHYREVNNRGIVDGLLGGRWPIVAKVSITAGRLMVSRGDSLLRSSRLQRGSRSRSRGGSRSCGRSCSCDR